jgi:two-component system nitrate/nitrite response regulator NarL
MTSVLVCDDHAVFADSLALVLADAGYRVAGVTYSPGDALPLLVRHQPDLCLIDLQFPDGVEALEHLPGLRRASPPTRFVLLSGFLGHDTVQAGTSAGISGFAHKGQQAAEILAMLGRVLAGERVVAALTRQRPRTEAHRIARYLTPREREVLTRLARGESTTALAKSMGVTRNTACSHVQSVLTKLGVHSQREAVIKAARHGLVSIQTGEWLG